MEPTQEARFVHTDRGDVRVRERMIGGEHVLVGPQRMSDADFMTTMEAAALDGVCDGVCTVCGYDQRMEPDGLVMTCGYCGYRVAFDGPRLRGWM